MKDFVNKYIDEPKEAFILRNQALVTSICKKYVPILKSSSNKGGIDFEDLMSMGTVGLMRAYNKYNPNLYDTKFSTYAVLIISGEIKKFFRDNFDVIRIPRENRSKYFKAFYLEILNENNDVIAEKLGCTIKEAIDIKEIHNIRSTKSLDKEIQNDNGDAPMAFGSIIPDNKSEDDLLFNIYIEDLNKLMTTDRQKQVFKHYSSCDGKTSKQIDISKELGVSQAQISRILIQVKNKVLKYFNEDITKIEVNIKDDVA